MPDVPHRPFSRLRLAAEDPGADALIDDLVDFHTEHPGITEATLGRFVTVDGLTGYDLLARALPAGARSVVDLGCGNGPLAALLGDYEVIGIDGCDAEIARARARLPSARFVTARGDALPLATASVDAVLSHHAVYLFAPIQPALAEVARVVRTGGLFAFATFLPDDPADFPTLNALFASSSPLTKAVIPWFPGWGDRRMWSREGIDGLLAGAFAPVTVTTRTIALEGAPEALSDVMLEFLYSAWLHEGDVRAELRARWTAILASGRLELPCSVVKALRR